MDHVTRHNTLHAWCNLLPTTASREQLESLKDSVVNCARCWNPTETEFELCWQIIQPLHTTEDVGGLLLLCAGDATHVEAVFKRYASKIRDSSPVYLFQAMAVSPVDEDTWRSHWRNLTSKPELLNYFCDGRSLKECLKTAQVSFTVACQKAEAARHAKLKHVWCWTTKHGQESFDVYVSNRGYRVMIVDCLRRIVIDDKSTPYCHPRLGKLTPRVFVKFVHLKPGLWFPKQTHELREGLMCGFLMFTLSAKLFVTDRMQKLTHLPAFRNQSGPVWHPEDHLTIRVPLSTAHLTRLLELVQLDEHLVSVDLSGLEGWVPAQVAATEVVFGTLFASVKHIDRINVPNNMPKLGAWASQLAKAANKANNQPSNYSHGYFRQYF